MKGLKKVESYLEEDLKLRYLSYLKNEKGGLSASKHLRNLIINEIDFKPNDDKVEEVKADEPKDYYLNTRLSQSEKVAYEKRSKEYGFENKNSLLLKLIREELDKAPQLKIEELEALRESNKQLLALGRNLNQIAKKINVDGSKHEQVTIKYLDTIAKYVEDMQIKILGLVAFSDSRKVK